MTTIRDQIEEQVTEMVEDNNSRMVEAWNAFADENYYETIGYLSYDECDELFDSPSDLARAVSNGFDINARFYARGDEVVSFNDLDGQDSVLDVNLLTDWIEENQNWVAYGIEVEEEEEEEDDE